MFGQLEFAGFVTGALGVALAIYQMVRASSARRIVKDWGADCYRRIGDAARALYELDNSVRSISNVDWPSKRSSVESSILERAREVANIRRTTRAFLENLLGGLPASLEDRADTLQETKHA